MVRAAFLLTAALLCTASMPLAAVSQEVQGTWKVCFVTGGTIEQTFAIVKLKTEGGKTKGELVTGRAGNANFSLKSVTEKGNILHIALQGGTLEMDFGMPLPKKAAKQILGTMVVNGTAYPGWLSATEEMTLEQKSWTRSLDCPPLQEARILTAKAAGLRSRAQQAKEADEKNDLLKQAAEADQFAKKEMPRLYKEVLTKYADQPAVFDAALNLVRTAQAGGSKPDEVKGWASTAAKSAQAYGPRWQFEYSGQLAAALINQEALVSLAVDYSRQAEKLLLPEAAPADQLRVLNLLVRALRKTGQNDDAKKIAARIRVMDEKLDRDYLADLPLPKGEPFKGRTGTSDRVAFMELFTGAMCPPCVAADLAFDVLQKTYKSSDLVLIQYHMHIPGPDPLTNTDTEARWAYYRKAFPKDVTGVPSSLFNGKSMAKGGGGTALAQKKYDAYREVIEPLLEEPSGAQITAKAQRQADRIDIHVEVKGLANPNPNQKLRILLTEETVRYPGSNKIRLHHNVVRAFPGGVTGKPLIQAASKHQVSINLGELRGQLDKYLDNYENTVRLFSNTARPMEFEHLRVIAIVQDDDTREILQAVQVGVEGK